MGRTNPRTKNPRKIAATLQTTFSGVALNDIDYLVERETGFEPATSTLARLHSTTELFPQHRNIYYRCGASVNPIARAAIAHQRVIWIGLRNDKTGQAVPRSARDHRRVRRDHKWLAHRHIGHGVKQFGLYCLHRHRLESAMPRLQQMQRKLNPLRSQRSPR